MTTALDWVLEVENKLTAGSLEARNRLTADVAADAETLTFDFDLNGIAPGSRLALDTEIVHVWETNTTAHTATVERAQYGSVAAAHTARTIVAVNSKFPRSDIFRELNYELASLGASLFAVYSLQLEFNPTKSGYDMVGVTNFDAIYSVDYRRISGMSNDWVPVATDHYRWSRNSDTDDFPSGFSLFLDGGMSGQPIQVVYFGKPMLLTDLTTDIVTTGLPDTAFDIPAIGAAARLVTPREVGRNDTSSQGDTRRSEEVPAGAVARSATYLMQFRQQRINEERTAFRRRYPVRH